jgi:hypothetical protein
MMSFSAVVLSWKRPHNIPIIVEALHAIPHIREIIVWNNDPEVTVDAPGALVFNAPKNYGCFPRYCVAPLAAYDNLWFQDDDICVHADQFELVRRRYVEDGGRIYGFRGRVIENGRYVMADVYGEVDIVIGQTMMFHRSLLSAVFRVIGKLPPIVEDDIAFCLSVGRKHYAVHAGTLHNLGMEDAVALHTRPGHAQRRQAAVDLYTRFFAVLRRDRDEPRASGTDAELGAETSETREEALGPMRSLDPGAT